MNVRHVTAILLLGLVVALAACGGDSRNGNAPPDAPVIENRGTVELTWWGQAMFVLTAADGTRVLFDPYSDIGYSVPTEEELAADVVTLSHEHPDHNNVALGGDATVLRGLTDDGWASIDETFGSTRIFSVDAFHDDTSGSERGRDALFVIETAGLRIANLGDLGQAELADIEVAVLLQASGGAQAAVKVVGPPVVAALDGAACLS